MGVKQLLGIKNDEQLLAENKALKSKVESLQSELDRVNEVNRQLQNQLADAPVKAAPVPTNSDLLKLRFKVGENVYGFNFPKVKLNGTDTTAEMVVNDPELQATLIEQQSGMIKLLK